MLWIVVQMLLQSGTNKEDRDMGQSWSNMGHLSSPCTLQIFV